MIWEIVILSEVASLSSWNVMNHRFAFLKSTTLHLVLNQRRIHLCTVPTGGRRERHSVLKRVWQNSDTWVHTRYETIAYCNSWDTHILLVVLLLTCEGSMLRITDRIYIYNKHKQCINKKTKGRTDAWWTMHLVAFIELTAEKNMSLSQLTFGHHYSVAEVLVWQLSLGWRSWIVHFGNLQ